MAHINPHINFNGNAEEAFKALTEKLQPMVYELGIFENININSFYSYGTR